MTYQEIQMMIRRIFEINSKKSSNLFFFTSALTSFGIEDLFHEIAKIALQTQTIENPNPKINDSQKSTGCSDC
jgi:peptide subunit release factor RF-3